MVTTNLVESARAILSLCLEVAILVGSLGVVLLRRVIYSALLLGLVFVCIALVYLLFNADFLAAAQVLVYVGAISVLVVFAIMLVATPDVDSHVAWTTGELVSALMLTLLFGLLLEMISTSSWRAVPSSILQPEPAVRPLGASSVQAIGLHLLTDSLLAFELLSVLLLVALVGAIVIARREGAAR